MVELGVYDVNAVAWDELLSKLGFRIVEEFDTGMLSWRNAFRAAYCKLSPAASIAKGIWIYIYCRLSNRKLQLALHTIFLTVRIIVALLLLLVWTSYKYSCNLGLLIPWEVLNSTAHQMSDQVLHCMLVKL